MLPRDVRSRRMNALSALVVLALGGCGGVGSCSSVKPLPVGGVPGYQTIEGGGQIRVTAAGLAKLVSILPGLVNSSLSAGFCVPNGDFFAGNYCTRYTPESGAICRPGCHVAVAVHPGSFSVSAKGSTTLHVAAGIDVDSRVYVKAGVRPFILDCTLTVSGRNVPIGIDLALGISSGNGALALNVAEVTNLDVAKLTLSGCGFADDVLNFIKGLFASQINNRAIAEIGPRLKNAIRQFLPDPLGIEGMLDIGELIGMSARGPALLETRLIAGGYASLAGNGINIGFITGINSDADPSTRQAGVRADNVRYASEPHRCVPPIPVADLNAPPYTLAPIQRSLITNGPAFTLMPAGEFTGVPEASGDVVIGLSETALNLFGHHLIASGALCIGVGTGPSLATLDLGDFNILLPSIGALQSKEGTDPVVIVGRPQRPIAMRVGNNTTDSPAITAQIDHMEIDLYGFLYQRYVRLLTIDLSANIGLNLVFEATPGGGATIKPVLVGVSGESVAVKVINSEFVKEKPQEIEAVLPTLLDIVVQRIGNIRPIAIPPFAGFTLADLTLRRVTTTQDNFLAINATLAPGAAARALAATDPFAAEAVAALDAQRVAVPGPSNGNARLINVNAPSAATIRDALFRTTGGALPSIAFDVDRFDDSTGSPRELEWSWNLNGGMWREFQSASPLVISDRAFAVQGKYTIGLQSRVKGDYRTVSEVAETEVVIDSVGPKVFAEDASWADDVLVVSVRDAVSGNDVRVAFGRPGTDVPETEWVSEADASLPRATFARLAVDGEVAVFARDALGNETVALVAPHGDASDASGCGCQSSGRPRAGTLILLGIVSVVVLRRRRRRDPMGLSSLSGFFGLPRAGVSPTPVEEVRSRIHLPSSSRIHDCRQLFCGGRNTRARLLRIVANVCLGAGVSAALSLQPGCSCGNPTRCEIAADCTACNDQQAFCVDHSCVCSDTVPVGQLGPYSDIAAGPKGEIWVSAYAQSHGDLVIAQTTGGRIPDDRWEWIDGVPDGPVVVSDTKIRSGVGDDGPDVGMYTSIAVARDGTPMVTYFDIDRSTLRFATKTNGAWRLSDIDIGAGDVANPGGSAAGMFSSLTLRADDDRPGVAYLAHVHDASGLRAEVRYAAAQTTAPNGPSDWQTWVVDTGVVPLTDMDHPNFFPLPQGLGLFIDSARNPMTQAPVIAYYDRGSGELKVSKFNPATSMFEAPIVLDGIGGLDAGWSPSLQVDANGIVHAAYVSTTNHDLWYVVEGSAPEIIDDGFRIVGSTVDGLPKPEFHFVGDDVNLLVQRERDPIVVYQDATSQELVFARRSAQGWDRASIAGGTAGETWPGAYGFFASAVMDGIGLIMSSWVIDQPINENWVEVFRRDF